MNKWWAYLHIEGTIQVKRYFSPLDIQEAQESDFVQLVMQPFAATDREDALAKAGAYFIE
jgi:hypothetical protein